MRQAMTLGIGGRSKSTKWDGMWLGIIMAYNVWFVIYKSKKALGILECSPEEKAKFNNVLFKN